MEGMLDGSGWLMHELRQECIDITTTFALCPSNAEAALANKDAYPADLTDDDADEETVHSNLPPPAVPWNGEHARPEPMQPLTVLALRALAEGGRQYLKEEDRQRVARNSISEQTALTVFRSSQEEEEDQ